MKIKCIIFLSLIILCYHFSFANQNTEIIQNRQTCRLIYIETNKNIAQYYYLSKNREVQFKKTPFENTNNIKTGVLDIGVGVTNDIPIAWDIKEKKLYLDTNRNFDLTDDIVLSASNITSPLQHFKFNQLALNNSQNSLKLKIELILSERDGGIFFDIKQYCFWVGETDIGNGKKLIVFLDNLDGAINEHDKIYIGKYKNESLVNLNETGRILTDPHHFIYSLFSSSEFTNGMIKVYPKLFINDAGYSVKYYEDAENNQIQIDFNKIPTNNASVKIKNNQNILSFILYGDFLVLLENPKSIEQIPIGKYNSYQLLYKINSDKGDIVLYEGKDLDISENSKTEINLPTAFNSADVTKNGDTLVINYQLVQTRGSIQYLYNLNNLSKETPTLKIYYEGKLIHSGSFSYG